MILHLLFLEQIKVKRTYDAVSEFQRLHFGIVYHTDPVRTGLPPCAIINLLSTLVAHDGFFLRRVHVVDQDASVVRHSAELVLALDRMPANGVHYASLLKTVHHFLGLALVQ